MNKQTQFSIFSFGNFCAIHTASFWIMILSVLSALTLTAYLVIKSHQKFMANAVGKPDSVLHAGIYLFLQICQKPFFLLMISYIIFSGLNLLKICFPGLLGSQGNAVLLYLLRTVEFGAFFWLIVNAVNAGKKLLLKWFSRTNNSFLHLISPLITNSLQAIFFLLIANILITELVDLGLPGLFLEKLTKILLIGVLGWIAVQMINICEKLILKQYSADNPADLSARKIHTQVTILKKILVSLGIIITAASILMVFDSVRNIGAGLLTTAGLLGAVGAFASQQSLGRIFAGLQIAFSQPIKIGDAVIIDNEFGEVEEITLSYIVIKLWDLRRLILPSDYFASRGLQNLTRTSTQLLGTIFLYADYTLPVEIIREKLAEYLNQSLYWDKKVCVLDVTDLKENTLEMRAVMSAMNASDLWKLRCEMREKLMRYIVKHYPQCLPVKRYLPPKNLPAQN